MSTLRTLSIFLFLLVLASCGDAPVDLTSIGGMNQALENNPADTAARYARAKYYLQNGKADSAMADMQELIKIDSSRSNYFLTLGDIYLVTNRTRYTKQALEKAISLDKTNQEAHMKLAELFLYVEMRQDALNELNEVLRINKNNPKYSKVSQIIILLINLYEEWFITYFKRINQIRSYKIQKEEKEKGITYDKHKGTGFIKIHSRATAFHRTG
jgi:tetratricopeptide (TPR) repeat protein